MNNYIWFTQGGVKPVLQESYANMGDEGEAVFTTCISDLTVCDS